MLGRDLLGEVDHLGDVVGRDRPARGLADVEVGDVLLERRRIVRRDVPDALRLGTGRRLHLVVADIGIGRQMADIGDVDHMGEGISLPGQHAAQRIGEHIGAQIAEMGVVVDRRPAGIDAHAALGIERLESFQPAGQRIVERELSAGHSGGIAARRHAASPRRLARDGGGNSPRDPPDRESRGAPARESTRAGSGFRRRVPSRPADGSARCRCSRPPSAAGQWRRRRIPP